MGGDALGGALGAITILPVGNDHIHAFFGQHLRRGCTDPAGCARNQGDFIGEFEVHSTDIILSASPQLVVRLSRASPDREKCPLAGELAQK